MTAAVPTIDVLRREAPAAHLALVGTVLVDTGGGTPDNVDRVMRFLAGRPVELIALTHAHLDHAGGAAELRDLLGAPIALHPADVPTLARDAVRLRQPIAPFEPDVLLADGDMLPGGIEIVATPGQTPGHVAFSIAAARTVLTGDLLQAKDVAWLPFGPDVIAIAIDSIRRLGALGATRGIPGHGAEVHDVPAAIDANLERYVAWATDPGRHATHIARRVTAGWIALQHPRPTRDEAAASLAATPVLVDAATAAGIPPAELVDGTLDDLVASEALAVDAAGRLAPCFPHEPVAP